MKLNTGLAAICLLSTLGIAQAGAVFRIEVENFSEDNQFFKGGESYITLTKIEGDRMRSDTQGEDGKVADGARVRAYREAGDLAAKWLDRADVATADKSRREDRGSLLDVLEELRELDE